MYVKLGQKEMKNYKMREIYIQEEMKVVVFGWLNQNILFPLNQKIEAFDPSNDKMYRHPTFYNMPDGEPFYI